MKLREKHIGLIIIALIALNFNSQFAQAARKTTSSIRFGKAYAYKKVGDNLVPLPEVKAERVIVKKTAVEVGKKNVYIGGYIVNTSDETIRHVRIFPKFADCKLENSAELENRMTRDELNIKPREIRRFAIVRPASEIEPLLNHRIPLEENCILYSREIQTN
ncbi:MAG: hypothetical protein GX221_03340 [Candidatus Riflebacteria bacterium]|nr:hypothetical protein [Candidatus Riflebacteria bacterium]